MESERSVLYEVAGQAAWITISRPEKLNALNRVTVEALVTATERALADADVRAIVLTGAGERAFVAGADIAELARLDATAGQAYARFLQGSLERIERAPKPVIAAVNGFALGGGLELAMACHVRIAAQTARFGQPEPSLGLIPGAGGTQRLPRLVGRGRALDLLLTGTPIDATEALRIGLVSHVVAPAELRARVEAYVATLCEKAPLALARLMQAVICGSEVALGEALELEAALFGLCFATADMREGTTAFLEKRKPAFAGR